MILTRVKRGLKTMKAATASQLAADLSLGRKDVEAALDFWVHRGDVRACEERVGPACGTTCTKCPIGRTAGHRAVGDGASGGGAPVVYEWVQS